MGFSCGYLMKLSQKSHAPLQSTITDLIAADTDGKKFSREEIILLLTEEFQKELKSSEEKYEIMRKSKDDLAKMSKEVKKSDEETKDLLKTQLSSEQGKVLQLQSEKTAILSMRAVLEVMLRIWRPKLSPTASARELSSPMLTGDNLSPQCLKDLKLLEMMDQFLQ
jgi:hypothetical protein